jgi:N-acetylated-alpha-linked acidic dipeptidase
MLEVISILGELRMQGWRPLRSIYFASWDAGEYNKIGSTEFVEDHIDDLRDNAIAYLNLDAGVIGSDFRASGSPVFNRALLRVLGRVDDPLRNTTLRDSWDRHNLKLGGLGGSSDYVAFQDLAGCSSIDIRFEGQPFPYHSCYETFEWMARFGDPGFLYHKALAQVLVLLILEIAQEPIVPFDFTAYASFLKREIRILEDHASGTGAPWNADDKSKPRWDTASLMKAANTLVKNSEDFQAWGDSWTNQFYGSGGFETNSMAMMRISHNTRMSNFETHLLDLPGGYGDPIGRKPPPGRVYGVSLRCIMKAAINV